MNSLRILTAGLLLPFCPVLLAQTSDLDHAAANVCQQIPWRELGPVSSGGRIVDIAVHPTNRATYWVAAASGGVWRTDNNGQSFTAQFQDHYTLSIGDLAVAPSNGEVLYLGSGEANNQRSSYWGNGVYKSSDGGKSWRHVGLDGSDHIGRVLVHPTNPDLVYVAALGALYSSNDTRGLFRSSDGGQTWQRIHHLGSEVGIVDLAMHPGDPNILLAAAYERRRRAWDFDEGGLGSRLWRSTDGGDKWQLQKDGLPEGELGRIGVTFAPGNGNIAYTIIENLNPLASPPKSDSTDRKPRRSQCGGEVYRSDDAGCTWHKTHDQGEVGGSPFYYYGQIHVDPNNSDSVYVLSVPLHHSQDGGKTWTPQRGKTGFASGLHVDHHALWLDPRDSKHCLLGNDGGLAETWDGGSTWRHCPRLPILQFYTVSADLAVPYRVYGGLQDNGVWGFPIHAPGSDGLTSKDAYRIGGGDGFYVLADPSDPDLVYCESQFGALTRQHLRRGEHKSIRPKAEKGQAALRWNWSSPLLLSPHSAHTLYFGSQFLHRSTDRGEHWTLVSPDLTSNDAAKLKGDVPHCTITSIAESERQAGRLYVGTDDGKVWTSGDGGARWVDLTDRFPAAVHGLWVSRVEASPHDANTAFVSFTGYRDDQRAPFLFRSDDRGETWRAITQGLPQEPINVVRQHPRNEACLLVGTEMGVYVSLDQGAQWLPLGKGLPRVAVHDLIVHPRESHVLLGTHGRGIWAMDAAALETLNLGQLAQPFCALNPSAGVLLPRRPNSGYRGAEQWNAANPFVTPTFRYLLSQDSDDPVKITVTDVAGNVLWTHEGKGEAGYHEVAWQARTQRGSPRQGGEAGGGRAAGPRAGQFAVTLQHGETSVKQTFTVYDRRPASALAPAADDDF